MAALVLVSQPGKSFAASDSHAHNASVQTTERYLGCRQKFHRAVNDNLGVEDS